jgi:hypothetical protein
MKIRLFLLGLVWISIATPFNALSSIGTSIGVPAAQAATPNERRQTAAELIETAEALEDNAPEAIAKLQQALTIYHLWRTIG